jgi:Protein of unknown function (DUF4238)
VVGTDGRRFETTPLNVGLERDLYLRVRPTGEKSDDIERVSLADIEGQALPVLQSLADMWPLAGREKLRVATYIGVQLVRGPRWFEWHEEFARTSYRSNLERGDFRAKSQEHGVSEEEVYEAHVEAHTNDTQKLLTMLQLGAKAGSAIGSMTWCLLAFESPCLVLADHPVVAWPIRAGGRFPERVEPATTGVLNFLEVRLPIAPELALLTAWADRPDLPKPFRCVSHHARNMNAFSMVQAERHWIHRPDAAVRAGTGPWMPLSTELIQGYSVRTAETSAARLATSQELNRKARGRVPGGEDPLHRAAGLTHGCLDEGDGNRRRSCPRGSDSRVVDVRRSAGERGAHGELVGAAKRREHARLAKIGTELGIH